MEVALRDISATRETRVGGYDKKRDPFPPPERMC